MGSVTIIFLAPIIFFVACFNSALYAIRGTNVSEIELPYAPEQGIVWEYDDINDDAFKLKEVEIRGDKQVFIFKGKKFYFGASEMMDLYFTDKNGNQLLYFAKDDPDYFALETKMIFYSHEDYILWEYTPKTQNSLKYGTWSTYDAFYDQSLSKDGAAFTFVDFSKADQWKSSKTFHYWTTECIEEITVDFYLNDGKVEVLKETVNSNPHHGEYDKP